MNPYTAYITSVAGNKASIILLIMADTYKIFSGIHAFYDQQQFVVDRCIEKATAWGVDTPRLTAIAPARTLYELHFKVTANSKTQSPAATALRNAAFEKYLELIKDLYDHCLINNDAIGADDRLALNIHSPSGGATAKVKADSEIITTPVVTVVSEELAVLHFVFSDSASLATHSKPARVAFMEIFAKIAIPTASPAVPSDCPLRFNITRNHQAITFEPEERGKTFFGFARWVSLTGKVGPWSGMFSGIIP